MKIVLFLLILCGLCNADFSTNVVVLRSMALDLNPVMPPMLTFKYQRAVESNMNVRVGKISILNSTNIMTVDFDSSKSGISKLTFSNSTDGIVMKIVDGTVITRVQEVVTREPITNVVLKVNKTRDALDMTPKQMSLNATNTMEEIIRTWLGTMIK